MIRLSRNIFTVIGFVLVAGLGRAALAGDAPTDGAGLDFFEKKVRPVLVEQCYSCHSIDARKAGKLKGELALDTREATLKGGENGVILVPGKVEESRLIKAVRYTDDDLKMPPKVRLSPDVVADLEKWVAMGAPDPRTAPADAGGPVASTKRVIDIAASREYWAFKPLAHPAVPLANRSDWGRTAIDQFILAQQEQRGVTPNEPIAKAQLIRRAYFDLIGLPPTPAEVEAFVADSAPGAYEALIDRLLASAHYGERWGRHWLDVVRFAESNGYEFDADRPGAFQYRDFVIRAFNQDMPYDEFVRLQLAGDKLKPGDYDATAATGFLVAGPSPGQITVKTAEPLRYDQLDDMISTFGSSVLGLTLGCCRCHDHKFDPVPQKDYYRLIACFADCDAAQVKLDPRRAEYDAALNKWKAEHAPIAAAWDRFVKEKAPARIEKWRAEASAAATTAPWLVLDVDRADVAVVSSGMTEHLKKMDDGSLLLEDLGRRNVTYKLSVKTKLKEMTGLRIEGLVDERSPAHGPGVGERGEFLLTRTVVRAAPINGKGKPLAVRLRAVAASAQAKSYELDLGLNTNQVDGWATGEPGKPAVAAVQFDKPVGYENGTELSIELSFDSGAPLARVRVSVMTAGRPVSLEGDSAPQNAREMEILLADSGGEVTDANRADLVRWLRRIDPEVQAAWSPVAAHLALEPLEPLETLFAAGLKGGRPVYHLTRGETNKKTELAHSGFLEVLEVGEDGDEHWTGKFTPRPNDNPKPEVESRVAMAKWVTDTDRGAGNLVARVMANRLWLHHMGRGLVGTPNDFGSQGDAPTHPELLDYLAGQLVRSGWRLKPLHKLIMTSAVYMQAGAPIDKSLAIDPENKLWWRRPPQRLEAEAIRDALLVLSGNLNEQMFGPGTLDEASPRRSVYLMVKRSKPVPFMQLFDAPEPAQSMGQRQVTTVATQALTMMNSPLVRLRSEQLAKRVRPTPQTPLSDAIDGAYRQAFCRRPTEAELSRSLQFIDRQGQSYGKGGEEAALVDVCQILLCSNEFVYVE